VFDVAISAIFEEFVVTRVENEQVRLIAEQLLHDPHQAIAGVGYAAAVDDLPFGLRLGGCQT